MRPFQLHYSEALVRRAVWAFWRRVIGWRYSVAMALLLVSVVSLAWSGDRSWQLGAFASMLCLGVGFAGVFYFVHYRASITRFRRMQSPGAIFEAGEDRFRLSSDVGSTELTWRAVTEVWRFPEFWLLFFSKAQFVTLPLTDLGEEGCAFVLDRAVSHGAKVR